jgi:hypothetical protein
MGGFAGNLEGISMMDPEGFGLVHQSELNQPIWTGASSSLLAYKLWETRQKSRENGQRAA